MHHERFALTIPGVSLLAVRIILFVLLFSSFLVLVTNLYALRKAKRLESEGVKGSGECVNHYWPQGGYVGVICAYSAGGDEYTVRSSRYSTAPAEIGDPVEVIYRPSDPGRSMLAFEVQSRVGFDVALSSVMGVLGVGALVGLLLTF
ncbi:DUF3592 domain-containing protein [Streptomyces pratensis]|uniref:DUF3592 domain-containing protein n=1 Tax=Streptomyces pratensis TaxID=1169025 RepID=UPI00301A4ECD